MSFEWQQRNKITCSSAAWLPRPQPHSLLKRCTNVGVCVRGCGLAWVCVCGSMLCCGCCAYIFLQRTNVMSDLVKTISRWQVWANSYAHTHTHRNTQTHTHTDWHSSSHRQRDTWRTLSWVSSACQPVSVSVAVTVSIAIATTSKGNSRPNHPKYPICPHALLLPPPLYSKDCCACILCICMHSEKG